jgi:L,D-peptidoglycan transpeptidase YkuD (ErfK/YbiS/YcfS/YnhG family)
VKKTIVLIFTGIVILTSGITAYVNYADQKNYHRAQTAINQLFSDKEHNILADNVDEALLKLNQNKINIVKDQGKKATLKKDLKKAKNLFRAEESANERVLALLEDGVLVEHSTNVQLDEAQKLVTSLTDKTLQTALQNTLDEAKIQFIALTHATQTVTALINDATNSLAEKVDRKTYNDAKHLINMIRNDSTKKELLVLLARVDNLLTQVEKKQAEAKAAEVKAAAEAKAVAEEKTKVAIANVKTINENQLSASSNRSKTPPPNQTEEKQETAFAKILASTKTAQNTDQIVTVIASGTSAKVILWEKSNGVWAEVFKTNGYVGSQGVGQAYEGSKRTPKGAYTLGFAFGQSNPGTKVPFRKITNNSYWISDVNSDLYNTWQEGNYAGNGNEHLADYANLQYYYAIVINYNTNSVKGEGSAFFLHVSNGRPTAGCVSVPKSDMENFMKRIHNGAYIINVTSEGEVANY